METSNQIIFFLFGFFFGSAAIILLYTILTSSKKKNEEKDDDLLSLKNHMQSIQQSLQNFNLAQDRIENTLIRGGPNNKVHGENLF